MELITRKDVQITGFLKTLERLLSNVESLTENCKPVFNGERFLTDRELSERLKISRRALQDYRNQGKIPYLHLGGKILYKESDVEKVLEKAYYKIRG